MRALILALTLATPLAAETPLSGEEFEALVEGKTLSFATEQGTYGTEYYAANRRVVWAFSGDNCVNGEWFEAESPSGPMICFEYENNPTPQCWQVFDQGGLLRAEFMNDPGTSVLYQARETEPLVCGGVGT